MRKANAVRGRQVGIQVGREPGRWAVMAVRHTMRCKEGSGCKRKGRLYCKVMEHIVGRLAEDSHTLRHALGQGWGQ